MTREMLRRYTPGWYPKVILYPPCGQGGSDHKERADLCPCSTWCSPVPDYTCGETSLSLPGPSLPLQNSIQNIKTLPKIV